MLKTKYTFTNFHSPSRLSNDLLTTEEEGRMFFQNMRIWLPHIAATYPKTTEPFPTQFSTSQHRLINNILYYNYTKHRLIITTPKITFGRTHEECDASKFFPKKPAHIFCASQYQQTEATATLAPPSWCPCMMTLIFISSTPYTSYTVTYHWHTAHSMTLYWPTLFTGRVTNASTVNEDCITSINFGTNIADKTLKLHKIRP